MDFLGDSKIKSIQTDGYNVYMYLDKEQELVDLMLKAVNYLQSFWKQLMVWCNDGNYSIDNNQAERSIRPLTV